LLRENINRLKMKEEGLCCWNWKTVAGELQDDE
jgi:hypothetical protein